MGWASHYIAALQAGKTVSFRPRGNSMTPRIKSGQLCTVAPVTLEALRVGDVVLCRVAGAEYLHLVVALGVRGVQIANNHGRVNGWTSTIYGRLLDTAP